jgi:protein gp37
MMNQGSHVKMGAKSSIQTPAAKRFVSYEPALAPVDFERCYRRHDGDGLCDHEDTGLDWIIIGGESGPGARPFDVAWARNTIRQCREAGIACFVKQLGADPREGNAGGNCGNLDCTHPDCGYIRLKLKDPKGGDWNEWPEDLRVREFPA